jgi:acetyl esterase/lipase
VTRRRRTALIAGAALGMLVAVLAVVLAGGGGRSGDARAPGTGTIERLVVGRGVRAAVVLRRPRTAADAPVVVFLHGWSGVDPALYGPWLRHLVRGGATVVFPVYQQPPFVDVRTPLVSAHAGLRSALRRIGRHGPLVAVGHSAGGALAADLAASARSAALPAPAAVYAIYPGRSLAAFPVRLDGPPPSRTPRRTRILALASPRDRVVGTETAREIVAGATRVPASRRTLRIVREPAVGDHLAPLRAGPRERRTFWVPLDRLLRQASGSRPSQLPAEP